MRKAIVEARQRIRERQVSGVVELGSGVEGGVAGSGEMEEDEGDGDAMDLD